MKTNFLRATDRRLGSLVALAATAAVLLLSGCVAPYGYDSHPRYRPYGYGYL